MIKVTWVVDDVAPPPLRAEHGYSVWIETPEGQVLFDTGGSGETLLHNLASLGLDPQELDAVVLSHGHDDHTGGLAALAPQLKRGTPVYAHPTLFRPRYSSKSGEMKMRGLRTPQSSMEDLVEFRFSREPIKVLSGVWTTGEVAPRPQPEGRSRWHFVKRDTEYVPDPYEDDLSLVLDTGDDHLIVVCGCCHAGLLNTLATVKRHWRAPIVAVMGGVHLANAPENVIASAVGTLKDMSSLRALWLGHCSGKEIRDSARAQLPAVMTRDQTAGHSLIYASGEVVCE